MRLRGNILSRPFASNIWINLVENRSQMYGHRSRGYYYGERWILIWLGRPHSDRNVFCDCVTEKISLLGLLAVYHCRNTHGGLLTKSIASSFPQVPFIVILARLGHC
jgi:hypothetical protein